MRVGEVLRLSVRRCSNLAAGVLTIRKSQIQQKTASCPWPQFNDSAAAGDTRSVLGEPGDSAAAILSESSLHKALQHGNGLRSSSANCCARMRHSPSAAEEKGPDLHGLRHAFAVHNLEHWYRQGENLDAKLPLLAAYLGHQSLAGTQRYLRLTPEIFPDIRIRLENFMGHAIPCRRGK